VVSLTCGDEACSSFRWCSRSCAAETKKTHRPWEVDEGYGSGASRCCPRPSAAPVTRTASAAAPPTALAQLGFYQHEFVDEIHVCQPTTEELETLELPPGGPVMRTWRAVTDQEGTMADVTAIE
jgi:hypothetical protein